MRQVLVVGGLDPTGGAGITADVLHLADLGLHGLPVATCTTVQTTERFDRLQAVDDRVFADMLDAAFATGRVLVVKTGLLADPAQVEALAQALDGRNVTLVVDPVLAASAAVPDERRRLVLAAIRRTLVPLAACLTPNAAELAELAGAPVGTIEEAENAAASLLQNGARAVLVTGIPHGDEVIDLLAEPAGTTLIAHARDDLRVHGTGCALASRIAGHLANGLALSRAASLAVSDLERLRQRSAPTGGQHLMAPFPLVTAGDAPGAIRAVETALPEILAMLPAAWVAECGGNVAFAPTGARTENEVAALVGRIRLVEGRPHAPPAARLGVSGHVARVALAAASVTGRSAAAMNLRSGPSLLAAAGHAGLTVGTFSRADEPSDSGSSVEWGTRAVFSMEPVDLVADSGGPGKEPMVRLVAEDPAALVAKLERLVIASAVLETPLVAVT